MVSLCPHGETRKRKNKGGYLIGMCSCLQPGTRPFRAVDSVRWRRRGRWCRYLDHDAASDGQISVEPGVPDPTPVTLNADLVAALLGPLRPRLHLEGWERVRKASLPTRDSLPGGTLGSSHPQAGAVRMRSHHGEAVPRLVASAHREGDDAGEVSGHKILKQAAEHASASGTSRHQKHPEIGKKGRPCWTAECPTDPPPSAPGNRPGADAACTPLRLERSIRT